MGGPEALAFLLARSDALDADAYDGVALAPVNVRKLSRLRIAK
jgi:hypothetical protein